MRYYVRGRWPSRHQFPERQPQGDAAPKPLPISPAERTEMARLADAGYGAPAIAKALGIAEDIVRIWRRQRAEAHDAQKKAERAPGAVSLPRFKSLEAAE